MMKLRKPLRKCQWLFCLCDFYKKSRAIFFDDEISFHSII